MFDVSAHARAARDAAFAHLGQWVAVYSLTRGRYECRAMLAGQGVEADFGASRLLQDGMTLRFRAEDAPAAGETVALIDGANGPETLHRHVTAVQFQDRLRLVVEVETAPR